MTGSGKFEELVVCSQEVAASTTQLVVSSKVKAPRGSKNLPQLAEASRNVTAATGKVVASAKSAAQMIEDLGMFHAMAADLVTNVLFHLRIQIWPRVFLVQVARLLIMLLIHLTPCCVRIFMV